MMLIELTGDRLQNWKCPSCSRKDDKLVLVELTKKPQKLPVAIYCSCCDEIILDASVAREALDSAHAFRAALKSAADQE